MFKKSIIFASLVLVGCNVFAEDISKITHLDCRYDHSKTELAVNKSKIGSVSDSDTAELLKSIKQVEVGYHVIVTYLWTRVSHTFYYYHTWESYPDEWDKLSKSKKASFKMLQDGKKAYYDLDETILKKIEPHPTKLEYDGSDVKDFHNFWSSMENMISRIDGSFHMKVSQHTYNAIYEGTCSVIEDSDRLF
jgi:hypothetical protein